MTPNLKFYPRQDSSKKKRYPHKILQKVEALLHPLPISSMGEFFVNLKVNEW